jgi:prolyl-tRNA synthetase
MLIEQSKILGKARKQAPSDADSVSHKLLSRAGFIDQLGAGIFSLLPLGYLANERLVNIIRQEMRAVDGLEVHLPALQPAALWAETGRLTTIDPPLFRVKDRHDKEFVLGSTHEEVITDLARKHIESYKDLPLAVFQIHTKFRNEVRATGGLLRVRDFQMKDLYSFHATEEELATYYERVKEAYKRVFARCDLKAHVVKADSGTIGGAVSHEFSVEAQAGEDKVAVCMKCDFAANVEVFAESEKTCPECGGTIEIRACIENGHIFQLGTKYSAAMGAMFTDDTGQKKPLVMGCYGIGVGRLLATVVETHNDDKGMIWPAAVAPADLHILALQPGVVAAAQEFAKKLSEKRDVLFDSRDITPGQKFAEADLIGIPWRVVMSEKTQAKGVVEITERKTGQQTLQPIEEFLARAAQYESAE